MLIHRYELHIYYYISKVQQNLMLSLLLISYNLNQMNQQFLTNFSIVVIKYLDPQQCLFLGNQSFLRSEIFASTNKREGDYQNYLFEIEIDAGINQFRTPIQFQQNIFLKHKISNKYLSYSTEFEDEENDTTVKLELSSTKTIFKILPCFQYQTKISNKVKFNEDVYLASELNGAKMGFLCFRPGENNQVMKTMIGLNYKSKINFHSYFQKEKQEIGYTYGQAVWLSHIQSATLLTTHQFDNREEIVFERLDEEESLQSINGLWTIDSVKYDISGNVHFGETFRLKSLCTEKYLAFSKSYKLIDNQRIYTLNLEEIPSAHSLFTFQSLKGEQNRIHKGSYLIFKHEQSGQFIGTRKQKKDQTTGFLPLANFTQFEDEDLFEIIELQEQEQEAIRFIFSVKIQFKYMKRLLERSALLSKPTYKEIFNIYQNIKIQLLKLQPLPIFKQVQQQLSVSLTDFCWQLKQFRSRYSNEDQHKIKLIMLIIYEIMIILCKNYRLNQIKAYSQVEIFTYDIFNNFGAEELISQIYRNNYGLLCKLPNNLETLGNMNLIKKICQNIISEEKRQKNLDYWLKMGKILDLIEVLLQFKGDCIDINQRLISNQLFQDGVFNKLFFEIKTLNQRVRFMHPQLKKWVEIEQIKEKELNTIIQRCFSLFSRLCQNRNFISKRYTHNYLNQHQKNGVQILITYLNIPISQKLSNNLFSLITNCYVDSYPRMKLYRPMAVIPFTPNPVFGIQTSSKMSAEQAMMSGRLKQALLGSAQRSYATKPIEIVNIVSIFSISFEPSLTSQQLSQYKEQLSEKITENAWSDDLLRSICILMQLQSYTVEQICEIKVLLNDKLLNRQLPSSMISFAMEIFSQISVCCYEFEIKKINMYLQYMFAFGNREMQVLQINQLLPQSSILPLPVENKQLSQQENNILKNKVKKIEEYNNYVATLQSLYPTEKLKKSLFDLFINNQDYSFDVLKNIFSMLLRFYNPKLGLIKLLSKSIIIPPEQISTFDNLYLLYKRIRHLTSISEHWVSLIANNNISSQQVQQFLGIICQITNYLFGQLVKEPLSQQSNDEININHQLLLKNLGLHFIILELLKKNLYLLEGKTRKQINKKQRQIFEACFNFLYYFCRGCIQNIVQISEVIHQLERFRYLLQVGQTKLFILLYQNIESLRKQIKFSMFEVVIKKIVKVGKGNQLCQFNPEILQYIIVCCSAGTLIKQNLEIIYNILENENILKGILFIEKRHGQYQMCLEILKFKADPLQVPFIYHRYILKLLILMIQELGSAGNALKNRLKEYISLEFIFSFLGEPDIYTNTGVLAQLNFLLKKQMVILANLYLERNDSLLKLYSSENLNNLLSHYTSIFLFESQAKHLQAQNQHVMIPYLKDYKEGLEQDKRNKRDFYEKLIHPLLVKIYLIFQKNLNKEKNQIYLKLQNLLSNVKLDNLTHDHLFLKKETGFQNVNIKWRNFVDDDEENSVEEKYAKKTMLELLRNHNTYDQIQAEKQHFYNIISLQQEKYMKVMSILIKMALEEENSMIQQEHSVGNFYIFVHNISEYLAWRSKKKVGAKLWVGQHLLQTLIGYVIRQSFNINQPSMRKSLYEILRITNYLFDNDKESTILKIFYKFVHQNSSCFRFFQCIRDCINEVYHRIDKEDSQYQINLALSQLYLCGQEKKIQIDKQAFKFLTLICKYQPFTDLIRNQPYTFSVDFLDKIYNLFSFMINKQGENTLAVTISIVQITEIILDCLVSMLNGCNNTNQNFIIDNRFTDIVVKALKMDSIHYSPAKTQISRRDRLLDQVIQFYNSNGINLQQLLEQRIKMIDFRQIYLLNRLKYSLLKLLLQTTLANERSSSKVKILVPNQLLKINLIWLYEDFVKSKLKYEESLILRQKQEWSVVVQKNPHGIFLMIGFYYFHLIECNQNSQEAEDEEIEVTNDIEKQKQKIVKKFFSSIAQKDKKIQKINSLQKQPYADQMKMFYFKYYDAYNYFKKKTLSIEGNIFGNLVKLYFPRIPLCDKFTQKQEEKLIESAQRISHDEKLKSLIEFESQSYETMQGEQDYFHLINKKSMILGKIIKLVKDQEDVYLAIWIVSCLVILAYLINDFSLPLNTFNATFINWLTPSSTIDLILLLLSMVNLLLGTLILVNLVIKKLPFMIRFYQKKYQQQQKKQKIGIKNSMLIFKVKNILYNTFFDIYVIVFTTMSIMHPLFTGFLAIYIISRISLGKQIVQAIQQTWFSLLIATSLLVVFNYIYSIYIYSASYTDDTGYGTTCTNLFRCVLMLLDQSLKSGSGFLGTAVDNNNFNNMVFDLKFISEITYILFAQKVIFEIFSGTIIDKFSQLRQKGESTEEDQKSNCFICGQQRFQIDFELQGFEEHVEQTHNKLNYIYYMFYLRRKSIKQYGIEQKYIWVLHQNGDNSWIPDGTSLLKMMKMQEEDEQKQGKKQPEHQKYYEKKIQELKKVKQKLQNFNNQLKDESLTI